MGSAPQSREEEIVIKSRAHFLSQRSIYSKHRNTS